MKLDPDLVLRLKSQPPFAKKSSTLGLLTGLNFSKYSKNPKKPAGPGGEGVNRFGDSTNARRGAKREYLRREQERLEVELTRLRSTGADPQNLPDNVSSQILTIESNLAIVSTRLARFDSINSGADPQYIDSLEVSPGSSAPSLAEVAAAAFEEREPVVLPAFLQSCGQNSEASSLQLQYCENLVTLISENLIEPYNNKSSTEVTPDFAVGNCTLTSGITVVNGKVVGADNLEGSEFSYFSVAKTGEKNAFNARNIPFRTILEEASKICDGGVVLKSLIDERSLTQLRNGEVEITNRLAFDLLMDLASEKSVETPAGAPEAIK